MDLKQIYRNNRGSILRTIIYTIGHFLIAAGTILALSDVPIIIAMTDAILEPLLNSVWYFILDKWWASKSQKM
jgi:uncharacterized membrane protein|tara:strand:- start:32 stop:250 length:219 start_codon:yes stop_codon:yes gene_type:complete